jgi:hypothetical protein
MLGSKPKVSLWGLLIFFYSAQLSATILALPCNGKISIKKANTTWEEVKEISAILPGDSIKTGLFSECMVQMNTYSYLIILPNTLLTYSVPQSNHNSKNKNRILEPSSEFNLIEGGIVVRLSQNRENSYFTLNTEITFGGIKSSTLKTSVLFKVESKDKIELWSIYEGKVNLIARNPEAGSLSISGSEFITVTPTTLFKRSKVVKDSNSSVFKTMLSSQFETLTNAEKVVHSITTSSSSESIKSLKKMFLSLSTKSDEIHRTIIKKASEFPSKESARALGLSKTINSCSTHLEKILETNSHLPVLSKGDNIPLTSTDKNKNESDRLTQLNLILKKISEIKDEVNLKGKLQTVRQAKELQPDKILTELRLIKRQIEGVKSKDSTEAVQKMSNTLLRIVEAIERKLTI